MFFYVFFMFFLVFTVFSFVTTRHKKNTISLILTDGVRGRFLFLIA